VSIKVSSNLVNANANYPLIRAEDNQVSGLGYFTSVSDRLNHPYNKRSNSFIAVLKGAGDSFVYQFTGDVDVDGQWENAEYWQPMANYANVLGLVLEGVTKFLESSHSVTYTNGVIGDFNQDGDVDIKDLLEFLFTYGTATNVEKDVNIGDGSRSPGSIARTTNERVASRVGSGVSRDPFIATFEYNNFVSDSDYQIPTSRAVADYISTFSHSNISTSDLTLAENRELDITGYDLTLPTTAGDIKFNGTTGNIYAQSKVIVEGTASVGGNIVLYESKAVGGLKYAALSAPATLTASYSLKLPDGDGTVGQALTTDGAGELLFSSNVPTATLATDATTLATPRAIFGHDFDGSAALTGVIASAYLDADTAHLSGTQTFTGAKVIESRLFEAPDGVDGNVCGDIVQFGTTSVTKGKIYFYDSDGTSGDCWTLTNATTVANSKGLLAVAMGTGTASLVGMCLKGRVNLNHDPGAAADVLYLSEDAAGYATSVPPEDSAEIVRVIGYALSADGNDVWFNPDSTWVEIA
jgi:hypothetical protein